MRLVILGLIMGMFLVISGCAATHAPAVGLIYTETKAPMMATTHTNATKEGKAECVSILGLIAKGDCSIEAAARAGGITKIATVDYESLNILLIYATMTTVVRGE
jgi:hypothetical protein